MHSVIAQVTYTAFCTYLLVATAQHKTKPWFSAGTCTESKKLTQNEERDRGQRRTKVQEVPLYPDRAVCSPHSLLFLYHHHVYLSEVPAKVTESALTRMAPSARQLARHKNVAQKQYMLALYYAEQLSMSLIHFQSFVHLAWDMNMTGVDH